MRNRLQDNPLWLLVGSVFLFSLIILLLLLFRRPLSQDAQNTSVQNNKTISSPTPTPQVSIAIPVLQKRHYNPVSITFDKTVSTTSSYTSTIVSFTVDGLHEFALVNTPTGTVPSGGFPVVILDHGYIVPSQYDTATSYASIANFFAQNGYLVIKPDYRGNGNSDGASDPLQRYNYPIDVMTLLASLQNIPHANTSHIYLWGHSMGGEVTLTVMEILGKQPDLAKSVKAAVLWAPVTDPAAWFSPENLKKIPEAYLTPFPYTRTFQILGQPSDSSPIWQSINPLNYLSSITIPVQLHHGIGDQTVPYSSSQDLTKKMNVAGKHIDFITYPGADHNLSPDTIQALENSLQFFQNH